MQAVLEKGLSFRFLAKGWSMAPFIRDGDHITVSPLKGTSLKVGDVYAFVDPEVDKIVVHRAVASYDNALMLKGDSSFAKPDGIIPFKFLIGRVTHIERGGHQVILGLGIERYLIACLSRLGFLTPMYFWLASWKNFFQKE